MKLLGVKIHSVIAIAESNHDSITAHLRIQGWPGIAGFTVGIAIAFKAWSPPQQFWKAHVGSSVGPRRSLGFSWIFQF